MERIEDKKRRLAKEYGITVLSKGKKNPIQKKEDGTYTVDLAVVHKKIVGDIGIAKVKRVSGKEDIVVIKWDTISNQYNVIADENMIDGMIVEIIALYGEDSNSSNGDKPEKTKE